MTTIWGSLIELVSSITPFSLLWIAIRAAALLLLAGWLTRYLSGTSATGRHLIWLAAMIAVLAAPGASILLPGMDLHVLPANEVASQVARLSPRSQALLADEPSEAGTGEPASGALPGARLNGLSTWTDSLSRIPWKGSLVAIYLLGLVLQLTFLGVGIARLGWLTHRCRRADSALESLARKLALSLGIRRPIQVRVSKRVQVPFVWGVIRPVILLTGDSLKWSRQQQRDALAHELAHVARLDWVSLLIGRVACLVYWPLPLGWWAARHMSREAERACDDQVLLLGGGAADYARQLLELASNRRMWIVPTASYLLQKSEISNRIRAILDPELRRKRMKKNLYCTALIVGLLAAVAVGAIRLEPSLSPQSRTDIALLEAAASGDLNQVTRLLQGGADPNLLVPGERTPLIRAADKGHLLVVRALLERGADPNRTDRASSRRFPEIPRSPLGAASSSGHTEVVEVLLQSGAEVDLAPRGDGTPLMWAAGAGHEMVVDQLLEAGADPNRVIRGDGTALMEAAGGGHQRVVGLLLDAGADPSLSSRGDGTALYKAINSGEDSIVKQLLDAGADTNYSPRGDATPLARATRRGDTDAVARLLEAGADPNYTPRGDPSALMEAASQGDLETISMLVERGADPNRAVPGDGNPLIAAARAGQAEAIDLLIDLGARPDASVRGDGSPLIAAAVNGDVAAARVLLERGADVNAAVGGDENPLINAARRGHIEVAILLLDRGAEVDTQIRDNGRIYTALGEARRMGHSEMEKLLLSHGARP